MITKISILTTIILFGVAAFSYNVKSGYSIIIQRLKAGKKYEGFFKELFTLGSNPFDRGDMIPFYIEKTEDEQINEFVDKHNFCLNLFFFCLSIAIFIAVISILIGNE